MTPAVLLLLTITVPRFEPAPCPVETAPGEKIECGVLVARENRAKPESREIRMPVMIFRSSAATPAPDPLLFMTGGPGGSGVARQRSGKDNPFLAERDYIVLETRGSRHARPALECPPINALKGEMAAGRLRDDAARKELEHAAAACRATLTASGVDLDGYNTAAVADDIEDLRKLLGYESWNLFGLSYGTRVALTVLRRHPRAVRSVILDSVLPPDVHFDEMAGTNLWRSLNAVFDGCAADRDCAAAYPDLRKRLASLIAAADRAPLDLGLTAGDKPVIVRGAEIVAALYSALHNSQTIPNIPRILTNASAGRYDELTPLIRDDQGPSSFTWGMRLSVWCSEEMPFEDPSRIAAQLSPQLGLGGIDETTTSPEVCRAWSVAASPSVENEPVKSDVPALIFAGEFDPDTPPEWGRRLLETMPNAKYVEMRGRSHGASFHRCGAEIATAFLRAPRGPLAVDCALKMRGANF